MVSVHFETNDGQKKERRNSYDLRKKVEKPVYKKILKRLYWQINTKMHFLVIFAIKY